MRRSSPMGVIDVKLTRKDLARLQRGVTASGGIQDLIRRLQSGVRRRTKDDWWLTVDATDIDRIARYWKTTGGKPGSGGYQQRLPVESLRQYLPSVAPLFADPVQQTLVPSYVYFKRQRLGGDGRIKIGKSGGKRRFATRSTDNPNQLTILLVLEVPPDEAYYHAKFNRLRVSPQQEWFWPGDELLEFIERAKSA